MKDKARAYELTERSLMESVTEIYEVDSLPEPQRKFYWLVIRYRSKVSTRLLDQLPPLRKRGGVLFNERLKAAMKDTTALVLNKDFGPAEPSWTMPLVDYRNFSPKEKKDE